MSRTPGLVIAPSLFNYVTEVAQAIAKGDVALEDRVRGNDRLVLFLENFVTQFADSVLEVNLQGLSQAALDEWVAQRLYLSRTPDTESAQRLMFALEKTFSLIGELAYGGDPGDLAEFRGQYMPEVLDKIVQWTQDWPGLDDALLNAAYSAFCDYSGAVEEA